MVALLPFVWVAAVARGPRSRFASRLSIDWAMQRRRYNSCSSRKAIDLNVSIRENRRNLRRDVVRPGADRACFTHSNARRPNKNPIALHVEDIEAARAELESRGISFNGDTFA